MRNNANINKQKQRNRYNAHNQILVMIALLYPDAEFQVRILCVCHLYHAIIVYILIYIDILLPWYNYSLRII